MSESDWAASLARLSETLAQRARLRPAGSYTTKLMEGGAAAIGAKVKEEADELIEAAEESEEAGRQHMIHEAADLLYHAMVLLAWRGASIEEVAAELARREGTSGLVEKQQRTQTNLDPDA